MNPTEAELADFLKSARAGNAETRINPISCNPQQAAELAQLAARPPVGLTLYKFGSRSVVGSYLMSDCTPVVLKYYYPKQLHKHLTYGINGSRCMRSWVSALGFQFLGLPTPAALFIAEWHRFGGIWLSKSFLATAQAPGVTLDEWVKRHANDPEKLANMADRLAGIFARMTAYRIVHGDLKATNLIVAEDDSVSFVDLDAVTLLCPSSQWSALRERDLQIFKGNWSRQPEVAAAFARVFSQ
jgi:tRNA A-37 threonylcarbamoyl transferase component Bud32